MIGTPAALLSGLFFWPPDVFLYWPCLQVCADLVQLCEELATFKEALFNDATHTIF